MRKDERRLTISVVDSHGRTSGNVDVLVPATAFERDVSDDDFNTRWILPAILNLRHLVRLEISKQ